MGQVRAAKVRAGRLALAGGVPWIGWDVDVGTKRVLVRAGTSSELPLGEAPDFQNSRTLALGCSDHSQRRELGARASQGRVGCSLGRYIDAVSSEASHDEVEVDFFTKKCCRDIICSLENPRLFRIALMRRCSTRRVPRP